MVKEGDGKNWDGGVVYSEEIVPERESFLDGKYEIGKGFVIGHRVLQSNLGFIGIYIIMDNLVIIGV